MPTKKTYKQPSLVHSAQPLDQHVKDNNDFWNWMQQPSQSLDADFENPTRSIPADWIPNYSQTANSLSPLVKGNTREWKRPDLVYVYGGKESLNVKGYLNEENGNLAMSSSVLERLLKGDTSAELDRRNPEVLAMMEEQNKNLSKDPTTNPQNTLAHELTHAMIRQLGVGRDPEPYKEDPLRAIKELNTYIPESAKKSDYARVDELEKGFTQPFFNSHAGQRIKNTSAAVLGHIFGAKAKNISP